MDYLIIALGLGASIWLARLAWALWTHKGGEP